MSTKAKQTHIVKIDYPKGKLTDFSVTNNQMNQSIFHIRGSKYISELELDDFKVANNSVTSYSSIYSRVVKLNIKNSHFYNNYGMHGGSVCGDYSNLIVNNSHFYNNSA